MHKSLVKNGAASRGSVKENQNSGEEGKDSLVNCDNKTNHCNRYLSDALVSGRNRSKLSIDDESSHQINGSNTNNKSLRKRNINMLNDGEKEKCDGSVGDNTKRMKVDGQDGSKSKMYQVSKWRANENFSDFLSPTFPIPFVNHFNCI